MPLHLVSDVGWFSQWPTIYPHMTAFPRGWDVHPLVYKTMKRWVLPLLFPKECGQTQSDSEGLREKEPAPSRSHWWMDMGVKNTRETQEVGSSVSAWWKWPKMNPVVHFRLSLSFLPPWLLILGRRSDWRQQDRLSHLSTCPCTTPLLDGPTTMPRAGDSARDSATTIQVRQRRGGFDDGDTSSMTRIWVQQRRDRLNSGDTGLTTRLQIRRPWYEFDDHDTGSTMRIRQPRNESEMCSKVSSLIWPFQSTTA